MDAMALQSGTELYEGSTEITKYETIDVTADNVDSLATKFTAVGTAGAEIGYLYKLNEDGTPAIQFTQVASPAAAGEFAYASETKALTFFETDPNKPVAGDVLAMVYTFQSADNAKRINIEAGNVPGVAIVTAFGWCRDICDGKEYLCQLEGRAQIDGCKVA